MNNRINVGNPVFYKSLWASAAVPTKLLRSTGLSHAHLRFRAVLSGIEAAGNRSGFGARSHGGPPRFFCVLFVPQGDQRIDPHGSARRRRYRNQRCSEQSHGDTREGHGIDGFDSIE